MSIKKKISGVFVVVVISAIAEFLTNIFMGRSLTPDVFGKFKFIHTIVMLIGSLFVFGQDSTIIRVLSKGHFKDYNWRSFIRKCLIFSLLCTSLALLIILTYYKLNAYFIYLLIAIGSSLGLRLYFSVLRAYGRYALAMFLSRGFSVIFFIIVADLFIGGTLASIDLDKLVIFYTLSFMLIFLTALWKTRCIEEGAKPILFSQAKDGVWIFLISISFTALVHLNNFFLAKMMQYSDVAVYSAGITITRGFDLVCSALWFVMMPMYSKDKTRPVLPDALKAMLIGAGIAVFYAFFGKFLITFLFKGKYDGAIPLLGLFIVIGFFKILYSIPSGIIGGRFSTFYLKMFFGLSVFSIVINVAGNCLLIPLMGIKGAALSTALAWGFRVLSSYFIVYLNTKNIMLTKV